MICWALEKGCDIYDFRGVSGDMDKGNPLHGLYRFKKGFNGEFVEFVGGVDLVFKPVVKTAVETAEKLYREMRKQLFLIKNRSERSAEQSAENE